MLEQISWTTAGLGGLLIGLAAIAMMLANGRIAGISGIAGALIVPRDADWMWRLAFVLGLVVSPYLVRLTGFEIATPANDHSVPVILLGGLLVGFGTQMGGGCTSGHGVCGMSRFSTRSITATLTFMATGFITVFVLHHVIGG